MSLKMQTRSSQVANHLVERRHASRGVFIRRRKAPADLGFELRSRSVATVAGHWTPLLFGWIGSDMEMLRARGCILIGRLRHAADNRGGGRPNSRAGSKEECTAIGRYRRGEPSLFLEFGSGDTAHDAPP